MLDSFSRKKIIIEVFGSIFLSGPVLDYFCRETYV